MHRIARAPVLFGDVVDSVSAWKALLPEGFLSLLLIKTLGGGQPHVFVTPHPEESQTKAHSRVCALAHAHILSLLDTAPTLADVSGTSGASTLPGSNLDEKQTSRKEPRR